ncbi:MAG: phosphatase PAP2 family protein [Acidobacteriia bacterium]|nr:phosphatase PAP2 family protein [Terriglobia bacterium]
MKALVPFVGFTAGLIAGDSWISRQVPGSLSQLKRSQNISDYGVYSLVGVAGGSYLWGSLTHNDHMRESGFLAGEAAVNSTAVAFLFKAITQRPRPLEADHNGTFFQGGSSFPSEHSAIAWSVASVLAHEYPGPLTKLAAYGLASAVTVTRVTGKQHFSADVVVGSALGWYFGRQIYRAHHDPELGGSSWGNVIEDSDQSDEPRNPQHMGSPSVPLDSWIYPALERLAALGYIKTAFLGAKPWTRMESASLVSEAKEKIDLEEGRGDAAKLELQLEQEFAYEFGLLEGNANRTATIESFYSRMVSVSGPPLNDSYHFGQTIDDDFGRPFRRGTNLQVGAASWASFGPLTLYVRSEFQHAPSAPALSDPVRNLIALRDDVPKQPAIPFLAVNRPHLLDAYVGLNLAGWQVSVGKQSLDWAPGPGGSLVWNDNIDPVRMVRVEKSNLQLPILGPARIEQFFGLLRGHSFVPHPYIFGQKINFRPLPFLELGFGRTIEIGGQGGDPLTFRNFFDAFFGRTLPAGPGRSVPGNTQTSMDWVFYVPKVRNYLVLYGELYADDDPLPILNLPKNPFRPGIYLTRVPGIPKLDFHAEAADTTSPGFFNFDGTNHGNLNYWNQTYRDGYTNEGNLIGNTVGRMGRAIQCWSTYWFSDASTLQFGYKHNTVSGDFIPGGGAWHDYRLRYDKYFKSGLYLRNELQYERISHYPLLFDSPRRNVSAIVEFGYSPHRQH